MMAEAPRLVDLGRSTSREALGKRTLERPARIGLQDVAVSKYDSLKRPFEDAPEGAAPSNPVDEKELSRVSCG